MREELWNAMGYTEYDPLRQVMRRVYPNTVSPTALPCGGGLAGGDLGMQTPPPAVTVTPPDEGDASPDSAPEGGVALPWRDERAGHAGAALEQVTTGHGRYYADGDMRYPSITTVLDRMGDRSALDAWRARVGEEEAARVQATAARIGDAVHERMSEFCAYGTEAVDPRDGDEADSIRAHVGRLRRAVRGHMTAIYATELPVKSTVLGAAGTVDLVCEWDGRLAVVDFKTKSRPMHPLALDRYYVQAGFYAICWKEMFGSTPNRLVILESVVNDAHAAIHSDTLYPHRVRPLSGETDGFMRALAAAKEECKGW